ncbi:MAG: ParB/RepB/Spo0J family partition protein [Lachnospiraceae bacterium]|nr:ParB/RepB/Spo0J family partition protein [Lachnospiraceae bacterium]
MGSKQMEMCSFPKEQNSEDSKKDIIHVPIEQLHDFRGHPFKVERDMALLELMQSIGKEGVIVPALVRPNPYGEGYEMIAGHRRKEACLWAGIGEMPVVVRNLDDNQAVIAMVDSNLQREYLKPSEKAFAYKMKLEAMKHQGRHGTVEDTLSQVGTRSDELLAKQVGESRNQIARYIRLTNLIPKVLDMVDEGKIAFTVAVELSYLTKEEQYKLHAVMDMEQCTPSLSQANRIKRMSQSGKLDMDAVFTVLSQEKPNQREQIRIRADTLADCFPEDFTMEQKVKLIERLVKDWHKRQMARDEPAHSR